jgi:hypothetical protein
MTPSAGTVTKRKLSPTQAAEQWKKAKAAVDKNRPLLEEAAEVLKPHIEKTGKPFKGIGLSLGSRLILDQEKVRAYLGKKLSKFQKRVPTKSLTLVSEDD